MASSVLEVIREETTDLDLHEFAAAKLAFHRERNGTVENSFTGDPVVADGVAKSRVRGRIEGMAPYAGYEHRADIALIACRHCPYHVIEIENIHIVINQNHMLEFRECREGQKSRLTLTTFIVFQTFFNL